MTNPTFSADKLWGNRRAGCSFRHAHDQKGDSLTRQAVTLSGGAALKANGFTAIVLQQSQLKGSGGLGVDAEVSSP